MCACACLAAVLVLAPASMLAAQVAQPESGAHVGVMSFAARRASQRK